MIKLRFLFFIVNVFNFIIWRANAEGCVLDPFQHRSPLLLTENDAIIYPKHGEKQIILPENEIIYLSCPQQELIINDTSYSRRVEVTCKSQKLFELNGKEVEWKQISCNNYINGDVRNLHSHCGVNTEMTEIGLYMDVFQLIFVRLMTICFDRKQQITLYSSYDLTSSIGARDTSTSRPWYWEDDDFYRISINLTQVYEKKVQRVTINNLLGLPSDSDKYIDDGADNYLAKGHLTAMEDFVYGILQNSTFHYINAAPQWQGFNNQNWKTAENDIRNYADRNNVNLKIWTGTYGVATLPHAQTNEDIPLYLYVDGNRRAIPVPAVYWKAVQNPVNKKGVVLIGVNNPYVKDVSKYVYCEDVSDQISWLTWHKSDIKKGYSYACTFDSFREVIDYVPDILVTGLLN